MFATFYPPYSFGGDAIGVQRLSRALVGRGHSVTVFHDADAYELLNGGPPTGGVDEPEGLDVVTLRSRLGPISPLLTQQTGRPVVHGPEIERRLAAGDFDILHYNNVSLVGGPGLLSLGEGVKVFEAHEHWLVCPSHVLWRHGREVCTGRECLRCVLSYRRPPQLWRYTGLLEKRLDEVDLLIAKSRFSADKHREFGLDREMEVIPYFLPDAELAPTRPERSPHPRPFFLFVGRLERIKGLDDVIPLFRDYADADLLIAGDGTYGDELRALAAGNDRVRFLGRVAPEDLAAYYRSAISLIVPSICYETFGIILIESFRHGTPVIARRIGPFPEIIEAARAGELFGDASELRAAMRRLATDRDHRERLAGRAFEAFQARWSESAVVPRYLESVGRAAAGAGRHELARVIERAA